MTAGWSGPVPADRRTEPRLVIGPLHVGRYRPRPTLAGGAVLTGALLLLGAALPLDDRRPTAVLVGAALLVVADALVAARRMTDISLTTTPDELGSTAAPVGIEVEVDAPTDALVEVEVHGWGLRATVETPGRCHLPVRVPFPAAFTVVALRLGLTGPLGLGRCWRHVTHRPVRSTHVVVPPSDVGIDLDRLVGAAVDDPVDVVGLVEGRAGAPLRDIHWPGTLRTGRLIVRERSPIDPVVVRVAVALPTIDARRVAAVVARAHAVGRELLSRGARIELWSVATTPLAPGTTLHADWRPTGSWEPAVPVRAVIDDRRDLHRRLARLVAGEVEAPPTPYVLIDTNGAEWVER